MVYDDVPAAPDLPEGWAARFIRPGDEEGILRVLTEAFERWPKHACSVEPLEHLRWKLASHPVARSFHVVVDSPEGIVGARLDWGLETMVGDRVRTVRMSIDRAVRPRFQQNYAMSAMRTYEQEFHDESFDMYQGYSADVPGLRNLQRYRARGVTRYRRLIDVLECDVPTGRESGDGAGRWEVRQASAFDERVDALWAAAQSQFRYGVVRSSAYLNWRYADPRAGNYVVLAAEEGDRWAGYAVLRVSGRTGHLVDLLALPSRDDVVDSLLSAATNRLRVEHVSRMECWSDPGSIYRGALDKAGFQRPRRSIGLTFRPLRFPPEEAAFLGDANASIHFTAGDTDLV